MGNFSFGQLLILFLLVLLMFGDFSKILTNIKRIFTTRKSRVTKKKTGKKGVEPLTFGFGNHCSTN